MNDSNPYAPPTVEDCQAPPTLAWQTRETELLVRNGTILPQVDLETGERNPDLKCIKRMHEGAGSFKHAIPATIGVLLVMVFDWNVIPVVVGVILLSRILLYRSPNTGRVLIWEYCGPHHHQKRVKRRIWGFSAMGAVFAAMMFSPSFILSHPNHLMMLGIAVGGSMLLIIGLALWIFLDQRKAKTLTGPPGWLRISPVHPEALAYLRELEHEARQQAAALPAPRKRLVRTMYYHRFPLRMLLGKRLNPLLALRIVLMKWLRSPLLEREVYHHSETESVTTEQLCPPLRAALDAWLALHPDWLWIDGGYFPSRLGDTQVHSTTLASPGLQYSVCITHAWSPLRPDGANTSHAFGAWLEDAAFIRTCDSPQLALKSPRLKTFRASGTPEEVFQAHRLNCAGLPISPPLDLEDLLSRIRRQKEEIDRLMTESGYQSEVREAA